MHSVAGGQLASFFPKADAAVPLTKHKPPSPTSRPTVVAPILDAEHADQALSRYSLEIAQDVYPTKTDNFAPAAVPQQLDDLRQYGDRYLFPVLTQNERLRLTMLFYYTHGALEDAELQSRLLEKVHFARDIVGWEFVIAGLLNHNTYTRMVTVGLPLAVLPRRESTCAHTVNQPPGTVFSLLNMTEDWRFRQSPHVEQGGLRAYAGVPLRFETEFGDHVAFGSLCVASNSPQAPLDKSQQQSLAHLADWIVGDIVHSARLRRQRDRQWMLGLLAEAEIQCSKDINMEEYILEMLRTKYPTASVRICKAANGEILLEGGAAFKTADLQNGLWEDTEYFEHIIQERNHQDMAMSRIVRVISTQCASEQTPTYLLVGSKDFRDVYDDIDSWFVMACAGILRRYWQSRALQEALHAKETFLRGITHQLRTPIHGIMSATELLAEDLKSRNAISQTASSSPSNISVVEMLGPHSYIKTIRKSARELISTVNSLIKLNQWADIAQTARIFAFHKIRDIETALLDDSLPALPEDLSLRPSIVCYHSFPPYLDMVSIDLRLLLDCIRPLIVNAIQNTVGGVVSIKLSFITRSNRLVIDVEDNGRGIATHDHERIFAAYEKTDPHTNEAGLGLTLACKSAELMNGRISLVFSEIGKGSHFRATFDELTCASSFPPRELIKQRLVQLPSTFWEVPPRSTAPSLRSSFKSFMAFHGYTASQRPEGSLALLDHTGNLSQPCHHIWQLQTDQVAFCLVPESAMCSIDFQDSRVQRENNLVYMKAPLLSSTFEEALELAHAVMTESTSSSFGSQNCDSGSEALAISGPASYSPIVGNILDTQHQGPISPPSMQTETAQPFERLCFRTSSPKPSLCTRMQATRQMALLVDDNVVNIRLLEMYCDRRSIPCRSAKDGEEAVSIFSGHHAALTPTFDPLLRQELTTALQQPFGVILMDLQMPVCDGITATRRIRELESENGWGRSTIFIITSQDSPTDRADADEAGADGYLVKPIGPKALDRLLKWWFPCVDIK